MSTRTTLAVPSALSSRAGNLEALEVASALLEAARETPFGGLEALVERTIGLALHQAREARRGQAALVREPPHRA